MNCMIVYVAEQRFCTAENVDLHHCIRLCVCCTVELKSSVFVYVHKQVMNIHSLAGSGGMPVLRMGR